MIWGWACAPVPTRAFGRQHRACPALRLHPRVSHAPSPPLPTPWSRPPPRPAAAAAPPGKGSGSGSAAAAPPGRPPSPPPRRSPPHQIGRRARAPAQGQGLGLGLAHLGHEAEVLARVPLEPIPRDPARGVLPGGGRVALAEGPAVLIAWRRADDPARHVVVRVHAVEEMGVAAVPGWG
eukprot:scaffold114068_cov54-Phaeocystis_antarctica.AAC.2